MSETNVKVLTETTEETETSATLKEFGKQVAKVTVVTVAASVLTYFAVKKTSSWMQSKLSDNDETPSESTS